MPQPNNGIAYSYVRFSSKRQEEGDSLRRQSQMAEEYALKNGLKLSSKNFQDLGISAFREGTRPSLADMLTAIDEGYITSGSTIIIEAIDRLSRRGIDATLETLKEILRKGVQIVSLSDDLRLDRDSLNDLTKIIRIALAADLAHAESKRKSERLRQTKNKQREDALTGKPINKILPFWLTGSADGYALSDRAEVARKIVRLKQEGKGSNMIAKVLNQEGIAGIRSPQWNHGSITKMLKNPALYGAYQTGETNKDREFIVLDLIENYYPPLITKEEWLLLQSDQNKSVRGRRTTHNPYSGLLRCFCGGALIKRQTTGKAKRHTIGEAKLYVYHICSNAKDGRCSQKLGIKELEPALAKILGRLDFKKKHTVDQSLNEERLMLEKRIANLNNQLATVDDIPLSVIQTIGNLEARLKEVTEAVLNTEREQRGIDAVDIEKLSSVTDSLELNVLLKRVLKGITVMPSGKNWRVEVEHISGDTQGFILADGEVRFVTDTIKLKKQLAEFEADRDPEENE